MDKYTIRGADGNLYTTDDPKELSLLMPLSYDYRYCMGVGTCSMAMMPDNLEPTGGINLNSEKIYEQSVPMQLTTPILALVLSDRLPIAKDYILFSTRDEFEAYRNDHPYLKLKEASYSIYQNDKLVRIKSASATDTPVMQDKGIQGQCQR